MTLRRGHDGYALLLMLLLLMGLGGVVAASFTGGAKQETERERYRHNQRVLREAKQALLQYAYNYPQFFNEGPGRLPCPDVDDNGLEDLTTAACDDNVGRLPWAEPELNFYDARDASNERLWYAVSDQFFKLGGGGVVNSDTAGSITIEDRSGGIIYDGTATGVAAVIIAPGPAIDRGGVAQDRAADPNDPVNYLDLFGAVDNADFVNASLNGFVMGPIEEIATGTVLVNDQIAVITTDEVIAMAEKATLQAYRDSLQAYSDRISADVAPPTAPWDRYYPWLYNYNVGDLDDYPADPSFATEKATYLGNTGRVPSLFGDSFTENTSEPIESELFIDFNLTYPTGTPVGFDRITPSALSGTMQFNDAAQHQFWTVATQPQLVQFINVAGQDGRLQFSGSGEPPVQRDLWFWDEAPVGTGTWSLCPDSGDDIDDCNRDSAGNPTPGFPNQNSAQILHVIAELDFSGAGGFDMDYSNPVTSSVDNAPSNSGHAFFSATYQAADMIAVPVTLKYEYDDDYNASFVVVETGTLVTSDLILGNVTLGLRYYPELPRWVFTNRWHRSVQFAYAPAYRPDAAPGDCVAGTDCLEIVSDFPGISNNKKALLVMAGENDWTDGDVAPQPVIAANGSFADEVDDVFNPENANFDRVFDIRTVADPLALGDTKLDKLLVVSEF
ncbi:MAG TPA: hypothetical protein VKB27_05875 [Gammaproteobacteria bacterium]|nr:hypothetical protein [Gammaproteobacteria bacterium]